MGAFKDNRSLGGNFDHHALYGDVAGIFKGDLGLAAFKDHFLIGGESHLLSGRHLPVFAHGFGLVVCDLQGCDLGRPGDAGATWGWTKLTVCIVLKFSS